MKVSLGRFPAVTFTDDSLLFLDEMVIGVCEYAPGKLIISYENTDNLSKCIDLKDFTDIAAPKSHTNPGKWSIQLMKGFDEYSYPFFFVTGASEIWIGSLSTNQC